VDQRGRIRNAGAGDVEAFQAGSGPQGKAIGNPRSTQIRRSANKSFLKTITIVAAGYLY
jgi:hypothetical protein